MEFRAHWTSQKTWRDPDCIECGGEGAPCCDPPYGTPPTYEQLCTCANTLLDALLRYGVPGGGVYNAWWSLRYLLEGKTADGRPITAKPRTYDQLTEQEGGPPNERW